MTITLYLEVSGRYKTKLETKYEYKEQISSMWHRMYTGKEVTVYYKLESKINFQKVVEEMEEQTKKKTA